VSLSSGLSGWIVAANAGFGQATARARASIDDWTVEALRARAK
jgi:hypothetical protein